MDSNTFGTAVEYHPSEPNDQARIHQFGKMEPGISILSQSRGRIWKGDILMGDVEDLVKLDATDFYPRRINAEAHKK